MARIVQAASDFTAGGVFCMLAASASPDLPKSLPKTLAALSTMPVTRLSQVERIVVQNAALRLAICGESLGLDRKVIDSTLRVVAHFADSPESLDALGEAPDSVVESFIGHPPEWTDRKPAGDVPLHERGFGMTRSSRPMRAGGMWANVGQLVAVDTAGHAHVTPVVGRLELRRGGATCTATLDVAWLRCGVPGALHLRDESVAPQGDANTLLFASHPERLQCRRCHAPNQAISGESPVTDADLSARRRALKDEVERRLAALRNPG